MAGWSEAQGKASLLKNSEVFAIHWHKLTPPLGSTGLASYVLIASVDVRSMTGIHSSRNSRISHISSTHFIQKLKAWSAISWGIPLCTENPKPLLPTW